MSADSLTVIPFLLWGALMCVLLTRRNTYPDGADDRAVRRDHLML